VNKKLFIFLFAIICIIASIYTSIYFDEIIHFSLLFDVITILAINILFIIYYIHKYGSIDSFDLVIVFLFCFMLYFLSYPIDHILGFSKKYDDDLVITVTLSYILANLSFILGIFISKLMIGNYSNKPLLNIPHNSTAKVWSVLFIILGLFFMFYDQYTIGGLSVLGIKNRLAYFLSQREFDQTNLSIPWREIINAGIFVYSMTIAKRKSFILFIIFLGILYSYYLFIMGSRSNILVSFLPVLAVLVKKGLIKSNKKRIVVFIVLVLILLSPTFTIIRSQFMGFNNYNSFSLKDLAFSNGETGNAFQITANLFQYNREFFHDVNSSYLSGILHIIPSFLYTYIFGHQKYPSLSDWYVMTFYPYTYQHGGGYGFSPISQAWLYGGYLGIFFVFLIVGIILHQINMRSKYKFLLLPFCFIFQRGSFHDVIVSLLYTVFFIYLILIMSKLPKKKDIIKVKNASKKLGRVS
jgi:oligosaccharide repeat unit polymerase